MSENRSANTEIEQWVISFEEIRSSSSRVMLDVIG